METTDERQMLAFFLPEGTLEYFELVRGTKTAHAIHLVLEEKNHPPLAVEQQGKQVWAKGFQDITGTDFPARGRPAPESRFAFSAAGSSRPMKSNVRTLPAKATPAACPWVAI